MAALLGGAMVAPVASALECTIIQQQKFVGKIYEACILTFNMILYYNLFFLIVHFLYKF